ncbi:MAG: DNA-processing protein DprA [Oscillospiraceae bacterium]|jgi:DNA processing protein|nr:DNA-processing protein DprA [Oscillospiraceae bacterium]
MKNELVYWVWLGCSIGFGSYKVKAINRFYSSIRKFYDAGRPEWESCGFLSSNEVRKLESFSVDDANLILKQCREKGIKVVSLRDPAYPRALKNIVNPPCVLYIKGEVDFNVEDIKIAVVGTRKATPYGLNVAYNLGFKLARCDAVVVSGGALGIDSAAHKGAINALGKTVCVLGCGISYRYLIKNEPLRTKISQIGALISEYPPNYPCAACTFPLRNRIISGLSRAVVVVEAGEKSGSLITANIALEQNRDVFSVPGNIESWASKGTNSLIRSGARPVVCARDIIEEYDLKPKKQPICRIAFKSQQQIVNGSNELSSDGSAVLDVLSHENSNGAMDLEDICELTDMPVQRVLSAMTQLEIRNLVKIFPGKKYSKLVGV